MLYSIYDWHQTALAPLRLWALASQNVLSDPAFPGSETRAARSVAAMCELFERSTRRYDKPKFGLEDTFCDGVWVNVTERVVSADPFCNLIHFSRSTKRRDPKVLIVAPMSGHYATLLRGTVQAMLPKHDVYITDWTDARQVPQSKGTFDLDDYVDYVMHYLRLLGPGAHVMAVCQPSVPVLGAVALMAEQDDEHQPATMTLMGGPIDTRINPTQVNDFAKRNPIDWFERTVLSRVPYGNPGAGRRVYPGFLQLTGFMSMNIDRHFGAHMKMFEHMVSGDGDSAEAHRKFYDEYMSVMDLTAEFYLQTVDVVFQKHALPKGEWVSRNRKIDPSKIKKTALLTIEGERDDISALGQTKAAHDLCTGLPKNMHGHHEQASVGHYGIFNGRRWREEIYPKVKDFIGEHDA